MASAGSTLYFVAHDGALWKSNGTAVGTVEVTSAPGKPFKLPRRSKANQRKGFVTLRVPVPLPGVLSLKGAGKKQPIRRTSWTVPRPGTYLVPVKLTAKGMKKLKKKLKAATRHHKRRAALQVKVKATYTPQGGTPITRTRSYRIVLRAK
jgi:hypothetical protein